MMSILQQASRGSNEISKTVFTAQGRSLSTRLEAGYTDYPVYDELATA
jgi:hypothetical protein